MTLADWQANGWLRAHTTSREEVAGLLAAANSDLRDAATPDLSPAWSFSIAYNAALHLCTLVLATEGYRADRDQKHYRSITALRLALGKEVAELVGFLDQCRTMRHDVTYEGTRSISRKEANELIRAVGELQALVASWLRRVHPELK